MLSPYGPVELRSVESLPSPKDMSMLLYSRRSCKKYRKDVLPARKDIEQLIDVARYAPTGHNSQDVSFIVLTDPDKIRKVGEAGLNGYRRILKLDSDTLVREVGKEKAYIVNLMAPRLQWHIDMYDKTGSMELTNNAPCAIIIHGPGPNRDDSFINATLATHNMSLQAMSMGLGTCMLGLLTAAVTQSTESLREIGIEIPQGQRLYMILAVGVQAKGFTIRSIPPRKAPSVTYV
ncbi:hypothetical protein ES708_31811 [subsurface metagenome]